MPSSFLPCYCLDSSPGFVWLALSHPLMCHLLSEAFSNLSRASCSKSLVTSISPSFIWHWTHSEIFKVFFMHCPLSPLEYWFHDNKFLLFSSFFHPLHLKITCHLEGVEFCYQLFICSISCTEKFANPKSRGEWFFKWSELSHVVSTQIKIIEHHQHLGSFSLSPSLFTLSPKVTTTLTPTIKLILPGFEFRMSRIIQYVMLCMLSFIQHYICENHPCSCL